MGMLRSVTAMAGCLSALVIVLAASAAGLTTLLLALPGTFEVLRYVGAAYLVFLGIKIWRSKVPCFEVHSVDQHPFVSGPALFRGGFAIAISNPKLILFAAAFFPQFVNPAQPQAVQFAILAVTFVLIETFWFVIYASGGRSLSRYISRPAIKRAFNRVSGTIFIGFGAVLFKMKSS